MNFCVIITYFSLNIDINIDLNITHKTVLSSIHNEKYVPKHWQKQCIWHQWFTKFLPSNEIVKIVHFITYLQEEKTQVKCILVHLKKIDERKPFILPKHWHQWCPKDWTSNIINSINSENMDLNIDRNNVYGINGSPNFSPLKK